MQDTGADRRAELSRPVHGMTDAGISYAHRSAGAAARGTVLCIHGALDGGASFARVRRRLPDVDVVTYDRRGYRASRGAGVAVGLEAHVDDALDVLKAARASGSHGPTVVLGHSFGGLVALGLVARHPSALDGVVAYEPPFPWGREPATDAVRAQSTDPGVAAEAFFRRIVGDDAWARLSDVERDARRLDGPALLEDLAVLQGTLPFDPSGVRLPVVVGISDEAPPRRRASVTGLLAMVSGASLVEFPRTGHGAHLSSPTMLAAVTAATLDDLQG